MTFFLTGRQGKGGKRTKAVRGKGIKKSGLRTLIEMGRIRYSCWVSPAPGPLDSVELLLIYTHSSGTGSLPFSSAKQTFVTWKEKQRHLKM